MKEGVEYHTFFFCPYARGYYLIILIKVSHTDRYERS